MEKLLVFIPGLSLLGYCAVLVRYFRFATETTPFFVVSSVISLLYIAAMFGVLRSASNILLITGLGLLLFSPLYLYSHKERVLKTYFSPGFIVSIGFIIIFALISWRMPFRAWDELSHWGPHAKFIYYNNGLINISQNVIHKNYPPAGALFYYYFFRLTGYSEGVAYVAQTVLMLAPLTILLQNFSWKRTINAIIFYSLTMELIVAFLKVSLGYRMTIYMDSAVGIFLGMGLVYYFQSARTARSILYLIPVLFSLILLKIQLIPLALLVLVMIVFDQLLTFRREKLIKRVQGKSIRQNILERASAFICLAIAPFLALLSWNRYLVNMHLSAGRKVLPSLSSLTNILTFNISDKERLILRALIENSHYPLIKLSILLCLVVLACLLKKSKLEKRQLLFIHSYMFLGFIAYLCGLLLMYFFGFSYYEAIHLASFHRYLGIYYTAWFLLALSDISFIFRSSPYTYSKRVTIPLLFIAIFLLFNVLHFNPLTYFTTKQKEKYFSDVHSTVYLRQHALKKIANAVKNTIPINHKILIVWQNTTGVEREALIYNLVPWTFLPAPFSFGKPGTGDTWTENLNTSGFKKLLGNANYLLLAYADKNFWQHYGTLFDNSHYPLPMQKPLTTYTVCMAPGFNGVNQPGCVFKQERAYLFRVVKQGSDIKLQNVAGNTE